MRNFSCSRCGNRVYFKNVTCLRCGHALGFDVRRLSVVALEPVDYPWGGEGPHFREIGASDAEPVRYCANYDFGVCNWVVPAGTEPPDCLACAMNRTVPDPTEAENRIAWRDLERAKKRLVYSLLRFGLPLDATAWGKGPMMFDFVRNATTGHLDGVITIDVTEADAVERERQRQALEEPYRSLLGHLRHEAGHFYWMGLVEAHGRLDAFRAVFGDERQDYGAALARHHSHGPPADWQELCVSAYASAHPWEDWAETFAHYLHMVDSLDTAEAVGMEPRAFRLSLGAIWPSFSYDIYREVAFDALMERWIPLTTAMNSMSRSMGHNDFYPFVIPAPAYAKLELVHRLIREHVAANTGSFWRIPTFG
jgi:hypothetical protein